jgi:hypothetical protein
VTVVGDTLVIAANDLPKEPDQFRGNRHLRLVRDPGGEMPLPAGAFQFAFPQIGSDRIGGIHLVWGEFSDTTGSIAAWMTLPTSLWHAVFRDGRWSNPQRLLQGRTLSWAANGRPFVIDSAGRAHIVVPMTAPSGGFSVAYLRLNAAGTVEQEVHFPGAGYASLTRLTEDSLLIAYSTADSLTPPGGSAIMTRLSKNGGHTWDSATVVDRPRVRNVSSPLVEFANGTLYALWIQAPAPANPKVTVRAFSARRSDASWTELPPVAIDGAPFRFLSAKARCGGFAAIVETVGGSPADPRLKLTELRVHDARLVAIELFPQLMHAGSVGIAADDDHLHLMFSAARAGDKNTTTATAIGRACPTT